MVGICCELLRKMRNNFRSDERAGARSLARASISILEFFLVWLTLFEYVLPSYDMYVIIISMSVFSPQTTGN